MWPWAPYLSYSLMLAVAAAASWTDLRRRRIPNRLLIRGAMGAVALHLIIWASAVAPSLWTTAPAPWSLVADAALAVLANTAVGLVAALSIYGLGLWSAGDAKLAMVLALAQPAWIELQGPVPWAPVLVLLANGVVAALVFLALEVLVRGTPALIRRARELVGERRWPITGDELATAGRIALGMAALVTALGPVRQWVAGEAGAVLSGGSFLAYLVLFLLYKPLHRITRHNAGLALAVALFVVSLAWTLWHDGVQGLGGVGHSLLIVVAVMASRVVLNASSRSFDSREVGVDELRPGMILSDEQVDRLEADKRYKEAFLPVLGDLRGFRLDQNYIDNLREWQSHNAPDEPFAIRSPIPFAPAMAVAVVLTAVTGRLWFRF